MPKPKRNSPILTSALCQNRAPLCPCSSRWSCGRASSGAACGVNQISYWLLKPWGYELRMEEDLCVDRMSYPAVSFGLSTKSCKPPSATTNQI